jgi:hypothetical protein
VPLLATHPASRVWSLFCSPSKCTAWVCGFITSNSKRGIGLFRYVMLKLLLAETLLYAKLIAD